MRVVFCFAALLVSCGGSVSPVSNVWVPAGVTESASATPPFSASDVASARALCAAAHGPVDPYASAHDLGERLVGAWLHCDPDPQFGPHWPGIELTADGLVYVLIDDGGGGLVRGLGVDNQGTWDVSVYGSQENELSSNTVDPNAQFYLDIYGAGAAGSPRPAFETNPRRLDYEEASSKWFVPLGHR
jgi:hypothetical protein